ncbi:arylmalonate decarboxylase [Cupriavidus necator H850]|uniref:maleate cis-trans isomerase family protein n=1 Tax=Cupriavidus necator TaxID=106590 RepID=UPI00129E6183|nr:arylmalonate decarboxylase [Cupriavidus necator]KAI3596433.1 arylmalonate decarboxylase [Cupriavidus necator H850]
MTDSLGSRRKYAVLIPSTNTSVQPEFDAMRPRGVTNHISRIRIPNIPLNNNDDFNHLIELIAAAQDEAVESVMSCEPDHLVLGISAETFWDGLAASRKLKAYLEQKTGLPVAMGSDACSLALDAYGARTIGVVTPYQPVGDDNVVRFFEECGYRVKKIKGLRCESPVRIAHVQPETLADALREVDGDDVDALVQVGTNLAMASLAGQVERELSKPVLAINTAIYWQALRSAGINDQIAGFGSLLERF